MCRISSFHMILHFFPIFAIDSQSFQEQIVFFSDPSAEVELFFCLLSILFHFFGVGDWF